MANVNRLCHICGNVTKKENNLSHCMMCGTNLTFMEEYFQERDYVTLKTDKSLKRHKGYLIITNKRMLFFAVNYMVEKILLTGLLGALIKQILFWDISKLIFSLKFSDIESVGECTFGMGGKGISIITQNGSFQVKHAEPERLIAKINKLIPSRTKRYRRCNECGNKCSKDAIFCGECGQQQPQKPPVPKIPAPQTPQAPQAPQTQQRNSVAMKPRDNGSNSIFNKHRLVISIAGGGIVLLLLILLINNANSPQAKMIGAIQALVKEYNEDAQMRVIYIEELKKQCVEALGNKSKPGGIYALDASVFSPDSNDYKIEPPDYDLNTTTEDEYIAKFADSVQNFFVMQVTDQERRYLDMPVNIRISTDVSGRCYAQFEDEEMATWLEDKYLFMCKLTDQYKAVSIAEHMRTQVDKIPSDRFKHEFNIVSANKLDDDSYDVEYKSHLPQTFSEAVPLGYQAFEKENTDKFFGEIPEQKLLSAFDAGCQSAIEKNEISLRKTNAFDSYDLGQDFQWFIDQSLESYETGYQDMTSSVEKDYLIPKQSLPRTSILTGANRGQPVKITLNEASFSTASWYRFYKISSSDVTEKGSLALSCIVHTGESINVNLSTGYYRIIEGVSDDFSSPDWYGSEYGYAATGSYKRWDQALHVQSGYSYTMESNVTASQDSQGAVDSTSIPWEDI